MLLSLSLQQPIWSFPPQVSAEIPCLFHCSLHIPLLSDHSHFSQARTMWNYTEEMRIRERFPKVMKNDPWNTMTHWEGSVFPTVLCKLYQKQLNQWLCWKKKSVQDVGEMKKPWVRWCLSPPLSVLQCLFFLNTSNTWIVLVLLLLEGILFVWRVVLVLKYSFARDAKLKFKLIIEILTDQTIIILLDTEWSIFQ